MIDEALPGNQIDRVFCNTGIEYTEIVNFVKEEQRKDPRIKIISSGRNIKQMLEEDGYPFKSKYHSEVLDRYQRIGDGYSSVDSYIHYEGSGTGRQCPKKLLYQFNPDFPIKVSKKCCENLKKKPFRQYEKENGIDICVTGIRSQEAGVRELNMLHHDCVIRDKNGNIKKFNPLAPVSDEFIDWYIKRNDIKLSSLYYEPYNFERTGCKGCPYNIKIGDTLELLREKLPAEYKQCWTIWRPVYEEYARLRYRRVKPYEEPNGTIRKG